MFFLIAKVKINFVSKQEKGLLALETLTALMDIFSQKNLLNQDKSSPKVRRRI
jgi:hypothetical protein